MDFVAKLAHKSEAAAATRPEKGLMTAAARPPPELGSRGYCCCLSFRYRVRRSKPKTLAARVLLPPTAASTLRM